MIPALLWWLSGAVITAVAGAAIVSFWDEIAGVVYRWLDAHGFHRAKKVFLRVERIGRKGLRKVTTLVVPEGKRRPRTVEERVVSEDQLSPEARARREATYDITEQVH